MPKFLACETELQWILFHVSSKAKSWLEQTKVKLWAALWHGSIWLQVLLGNNAKVPSLKG